MEIDEITLEYRIRSTLLKYLHGIDRADHNLRLSAFAPNGKMFIDGVQVIGPGAVVRTSNNPPAPGLPPRENIIAMSHHLHQADIRTFDTHYAVESNNTSYLVVKEGDQQYMLIRGVRYHDSMSNYSGQLLINERQHHIDWMFRAPEDFKIPTSSRHSFDDFVSRVQSSLSGQDDYPH